MFNANATAKPSAYQDSGIGVVDTFPGQEEWLTTQARTPPKPAAQPGALPGGPKPVVQRQVEHPRPPTSSAYSAAGDASGVPRTQPSYSAYSSPDRTDGPAPSISSAYSAYLAHVTGESGQPVVFHGPSAQFPGQNEPSAPTWQPRQTFDDAFGVAAPVGLGNAARRLVAGATGVGIGTLAAGALEQALPPGGSPGGQALAVIGTGAATLAGTVLAAHGLAQVMDCKASRWASRGLALTLSGGVLPALVARSASSASAAQAQARTAQVIAQFVSHLVAGITTEAVMQSTDGLTRRARIVDGKAGGSVSQGAAVFREWPFASAAVYGAAGLVAEFGLAPALEEAFGGDQPTGTAKALGSGLAQVLAHTVLELHDALVAMGLAHRDGLRLEAVPGNIGALCSNLCRLGETVRRVIDQAGARAFITSPSQFLRMAEALYASQPGATRVLRIIRGVFDGLARLNGHFVQESHPVRRAQASWAAAFRPNYETFIGSAGSGLDLREIEEQPGAPAADGGLRRRHQAGKPTGDDA